MKFDFSQARQGDCLLYSPSDLFGWIIAVKTWSSRACHVEVYIGNGESVASRNGIGVGVYPVRTSQLSEVRRPNRPFTYRNAMDWFYLKANGEKYDWLGLLVFWLAVRKGAMDRMFCSEFATRFYRHGGFSVVAPDWDADMVAPAQFLQTPAMDTVWRK
jgi:hypothetical protein